RAQPSVLRFPLSGYLVAYGVVKGSRVRSAVQRELPQSKCTLAAVLDKQFEFGDRSVVFIRGFGELLEFSEARIGEQLLVGFALPGVCFQMKRLFQTGIGVDIAAVGVLQVRDAGKMTHEGGKALRADLERL